MWIVRLSVPRRNSPCIELIRMTATAYELALDVPIDGLRKSPTQTNSSECRSVPAAVHNLDISICMAYARSSYA